MMRNYLREVISLIISTRTKAPEGLGLKKVRMVLTHWFLALPAEDKGLAISCAQKTGRVVQEWPGHSV